jgi:hypothetical protein
MGTPNGIGDGRSDLFVAGRHAIERTVWFDVVERHALGIEKRLQGADLICHQIGHFRRRNHHGPAAEALEIR